MNHNIPFKVGDLIKGPFCEDIVEILKIEYRNDILHLIGYNTKSKGFIDKLLSKNDIDKITVISNSNFFNQEAWKVFLALEAIRFRYATLYDPLLAMNISKVDPLPHQIEAVYGYVLKNPRIRFMIADDPGAGKTIMAGLIIKELKLRQHIKRILIVVPGHLKDQWQRELKEKFDENFKIIDRSRFDSEYRTNVWEEEYQMITSMDFAKREEILKTLNTVSFDLVIVDEAHKMSAYRYSDSITKSDRYKLGEVLSLNSNHLLFLTATPHKGDPDNFLLLLDLLEKGFFANYNLLKQSIINKDNPLFLRRLKEDLVDFDGKPLFMPRYVQTITFDLGTSSPKEKELYNELSLYIEKQYSILTQSSKTRSVSFALILLQRRFASSTYALLKSLERRKKRLIEYLENIPQSREKSENIDLEEFEDMPEEERWKKEFEWESLSAAQSEEDLKQEIQTIDSLIDKAKKIIDEESEIKLRKLKESLNELFSKIEGASPKKLLIFTESRDTLEYLETKIKQWGYKVNTIHGGMRQEDRINAESIFKNETDILIATEAAGEGINLQFCNLMINYDIPWNPNRLEQRMGRIHRYGQFREVFIHNLVAVDTREGKVLSKLFEKIEEIKIALGSDKVFDVIGQVIDAKKFIQAITDAALNARSVEEILKEIEVKVSQEYLSRVLDQLGETLATRYIDYTRIKDLAKKARENRLIPEYTQSFFIKAFEKAEGKIRPDSKEPKMFKITHIPSSIRKIAEDVIFKKSYGTILREYPRVIFDKELLKKYPNAELICFGQPLFEAVLNWVEKEFSEKILNGAIFYDPDGRLNGYIVFYEGAIEDGKGNIAGKRLFSVYVDEGVEEYQVKIVEPYILWDLIEENHPLDIKNNINIEEIKEKATSIIVQALDKYKTELQQERNRQANIKQKYGITSLKALIEKLEEELIDLNDRKELGENVDIVIRNKKIQKEEYLKSLEELESLIEKEKYLSMNTPQFVGIIRVLPKVIQDEDMVSDQEIEEIGMRIAMDYEIKNQRKPEDVSKQNLGFDIRSVDANGNIRYIEVKARNQEGNIVLTKNEWFKAQRFGNDYFLYVVFNATQENPELLVIQNPAKNLNPQPKIEDVRFIIDKKQIKKKEYRV